MAVKFYPNKVIKVRRMEGMNRHVFGKELGTTGHQVKLWETGKTLPSTKKIVLMCRRFDLDPNYFFSNQEAIVHEKTN